jgi:hypothetical protein
MLGTWLAEIGVSTMPTKDLDLSARRIKVSKKRMSLLRLTYVCVESDREHTEVSHVIVHECGSSFSGQAAEVN